MKTQETKNRRSFSDVDWMWFMKSKPIRKAFKWALIIIFLCLLFGPFLGLILWSFSEQWYWPALFPQELGMKYWKFLLTNQSIIQSTKLSFMIAPIVVAIAALVGIPASYALARKKVHWDKLLLILFLIPRAFPWISTYMNLAVLFYRLGLNGTFLGVILVHLLGALTFLIWITTSTFRSIDPVLEEAARDYGASELQIFFKITLPLAMPGIIVACILAFLHSLHEFTGTFIIGSPNYITMPVYIYSLVSGFERPLASVFSLVLLVPTVIVTAFLNNKLKSENMTGGAKG